ncbi:RICIN domain-containing protein [Saccharothrix violaceirubra]|uniref:Ricin B lectin domain-containing protein n=1 Tax=Saccharothrix violaceirubra TaxID=413306 RepID=A0A7W7SY14_9PSEU|nr:RICIN domain-containing protein [Saccharothrix violaceirubra]MBB4962963.1 hypothetical protein [Saccharothrix violaceirubra]
MIKLLSMVAAVGSLAILGATQASAATTDSGPAKATDVKVNGDVSTQACFGPFKIVNPYSNTVVDIDRASLAPGARITTAVRSTSASQLWYRCDSAFGGSVLISAHSGYCIDAALVPGQNLTQESCVGGFDQRFTSVLRFDGYYQTENVGTGLAFDTWQTLAPKYLGQDVRQITSPRQAWYAEYVATPGTLAPVA